MKSNLVLIGGYMKKRNLLKIILVLSVILISVLFLLFLNLLNIHDSFIEVLYGMIFGSLGYIVWYKLDSKIVKNT
jgi:hypothetical protein